MVKNSFKLAIVPILIFSFLFADSAFAKSVYSFNLFDFISNENFEKLSTEKKVDLLSVEVRKRDHLILSLKNNLKQKKVADLDLLFDQYILKVLKDNINRKINIMVKDSEAKKEIDFSSEKMSKDGLRPSGDLSLLTTKTVLEADIDNFIEQKNNIVDLDHLYKISHDKEIIALLKEGYAYPENIEVIATRWNFPNINNEYSEISNNRKNYDTNQDIVDYLNCINLTSNLCDEMVGKVDLQTNMGNYIKEKKAKDYLVRLEQEFNEAKQKYPNVLEKVAVISYNPECSQTKGGIKLGEDCYATTKYPCILGPNKGKESGLCGKPIIGAYGENLKEIVNSGKRPLAISLDMNVLKGREVYLRCTDKKGNLFIDPRCNGYFQVADTISGAKDTKVSLYIDEKDEKGKYKNIGNVLVDIYY